MPTFGPFVNLKDWRFLLFKIKKSIFKNYSLAKTVQQPVKVRIKSPLFSKNNSIAPLFDQRWRGSFSIYFLFFIVFFILTNFLIGYELNVPIVVAVFAWSWERKKGLYCLLSEFFSFLLSLMTQSIEMYISKAV